jgi:hypothetical protein
MREHSSLTPVPFWILTGIAALTLGLVVLNMVVFLSNSSLQREVNARQQFIQQSIQLEQLNREIITALANLSAQHKDDQLKALLAAHGITFTINPPAAGASGVPSTSQP